MIVLIVSGMMVCGLGREREPRAQVVRLLVVVVVCHGRLLFLLLSLLTDDKSTQPRYLMAHDRLNCQLARRVIPYISIHHSDQVLN